MSPKYIYLLIYHAISFSQIKCTISTIVSASKIIISENIILFKHYKSISHFIVFVGGK